MHAVRKTVFVNMSEGFDSEDDLQFFAQPYLFKPEYTDDELRESSSKRDELRDVLHQNAGSCISSTTCMRRSTLMNTRRRLTRKRRKC